MKKINYLMLNIYLFIESLLWTLIDLTRARRMKLTEKMHSKYVPQHPPDGDVEIINSSQE